MCNQTQAKELGLDTAAVCACGASFFDCEDDIAKAMEHITQRSGAAHKWVLVKEGYYFPSPDRLSVLEFECHDYGG